MNSFFFRLATSSHVSNTDPLEFYLTENNEQRFAKFDSGQPFVDNSKKSLAVVFNRVPRAIKKGEIEFELTSSNEMDFSSILSLLENKGRSNEIGRAHV